MLDLTADHIALLTDTDLRALVGLLCEQEMVKNQHSPSAVTWGGHQNAADGGLDVRVSLPTGATISGYVPKPQSGFQAKAKDMPRNAIIKEMAPGGELVESIVELARSGGAYIVVSSKGSLSDSALKDRVAAMNEALVALPNGLSLHVDFYDRRRIASWVNQHPTLATWVREKVGQPLKGWQTYKDWSSSPAGVDEPYLLDERLRIGSPSVRHAEGVALTEGMQTLRELLRKPKNVVRLVGLSGVGKTRLVQALFDDRIGQAALPQAEALYTDLSDEPDPVPLEMLSHLIQLGQRVVLIIDNCGVELHRKLAAKVSSSNCVLSVITIEYDINDDEPENTDVFKLEPASESLIEKMLEKRYPGIASPSLRVIAQFSAGNARVAFALAETAKKGASLANLRDSKLFRRLFEQVKGSSDALFDAAKVCALLYSFDGETLDGTDSELVPLAKIAGISVDELHKHVAELQRRQLGQRRGKWRAILPHALAHRLAGRALEDIPFARIEHGIIKGSSARMLRSFSRRVGYLHDDDRALAITAAWLADGGLLAPIGTLNELGETILENIAPVDPAATLAYFERAASRDASFFDPTNRNKRKILRIIRSLAYDAVLFERCVELLKRFVLAENADTHDSALDALKSLFQIYLSGSHATPLQRASFVMALLEDRRSEKLGLTLLQVMLECGPFTSHFSFEFGARKRDYGLHPNRGAEIKEWYVRALEVARIIGSAPTATAAAVRRHLAGRIPDMLARTGAVDEVIAICTGFAATSGWSEGWIGIRGALRRGKNRIPLPVREQLEQLEGQLRPQGLPAMIRSYALSPEWGALDIAEFEEDEEQRPFEARQRVNELCEELGQQIANDPDQLRALLPEILVAEAQKTFMLGSGIAVACTSLAECWAIVRDAFLEVLEPQRKLQMLGGFLSAAMRRSPVETESFLDEILSDPRFHTYFMWLQTCAGVTAVSFARMNQALDLATVPIDSFVHLAGGRAHEGLDDEQLGALAARVAEKEGGVPVAAQILGMRVFGRTSDKLPVGEPIKAAGRKFLENAQFVRGSSRLDYLLGEIAEVSFTGPEHEEQARRLCIRVLQGIRSYQVYASDVADLLKAITKTFPVVVLDVFVEQGDVEDDIRQTIFQEIREHQTSPLDDVPEDIWRAWAEEAPSTRYACLASVVKFSVGSDDAAAKEWSDTAKKLINAAPHVESVLDTFFARFEPMSWSGSRADIVASRLPLLESLRLHPRAEVAAWANARIPVLSAAVERERGNEARESRLRDEAFE